VVLSSTTSRSRATDQPTADAFASSWNRLGEGSVYSREQFLEWFEPISPEELRDQEILELGFGNGSLLYHVAAAGPRRLAGIELGNTIEQTLRNLRHVPAGILELHRGDLTRASLGLFDLVYCIGVLHHLQSPELGFDAVLRHVRPGGRFHCWVYAEEGNRLVITLVDPIRRLTSRLPWWLTKYLIALPLVLPYYAYAKLVRLLSRGKRRSTLARILPLYDYSLWIAERDLGFFRHVAFDQLVTPRTVYINRSRVERWLADPRVEPGSSYLIFRNANSWKFGGRVRSGG
jgi:SAM-dependent methyltransferase